jgi:hypothetical protein
MTIVVAAALFVGIFLGVKSALLFLGVAVAVTVVTDMLIKPRSDAFSLRCELPRDITVYQSR